MAQDGEVVIRGDDGTEHVFPPGFDPKRAAAIVRTQTGRPDAPSPAWNQPGGDVILDNLRSLRDLVLSPSGGGALGGAVGGVPGAMIGGAAGRGYQQLTQNWDQILPALRDLATTRTTQPEAVTRGAVQGMDTGIVDAGTSGAIQGAVQGAGTLLSKGMTTAAPWLMQTALKPTKALLEEYRTTGPALATTLLNEGVNVTPGGLQKLGVLLDANNAAISDAVRTAPPVNIPKPTIAARALTTAGKLAQQTNPTSALEALRDTVTEFLDHPVYKGDLSVPDAQAMKVGTYKAIGDRYGELSNASVETQKALARGLKEEVAAAVPGISDMNARDSQLMAGLDAVGRRVAQAGNVDPVGFAWAAVHRPASFVAAMIDRNAAVKSLIARGMWDQAGRVAGVAPNLIRTAVAAVAAGQPDAPDTTPGSARGLAPASSVTSGRR